LRRRVVAALAALASGFGLKADFRLFSPYMTTGGGDFRLRVAARSGLVTGLTTRPCRAVFGAF
jgi:hypothetical protein